MNELMYVICLEQCQAWSKHSELDVMVMTGFGIPATSSLWLSAHLAFR